MNARLFYQTLDSTMLEHARLSKFLADGDVLSIRAGNQTRGRGRGQNAWQSPSGGLWLTFSFHHADAVPSFPLFIGACLHRLLKSLFGLPGLRLKWPNDIYLDEAKLCGIICEYRQDAALYVISLGINTNVVLSKLSDEIKASNLISYLNMPVSNQILAELLVNEINSSRWMLGDPGAYLDYCNLWLYGKHRAAVVINGDRDQRGRIDAIGSQGELILLDDEGKTLSAFSGSLVFTQ